MYSIIISFKIICFCRILASIFFLLLTSVISAYSHALLSLPRLLVPLLGICTLISTAQAQTNFIPLERGDVVEREEKLTFSPGLELSGNYRLRSTLLSTSSLPASRIETNSPEEFSFDHDLRLKLRSTVHRTISINLELATEQEPIYLADLRERRGNRHLNPDSQSANIGARQFFLELNTHPRDETRIGKQEVNIGDRRGKVFSGILSGFTQRCKAGTWCYEFGALKLSSVDGDWLYFLSLDYPFWSQTDSGGNALDVFRAEIFRIKYTEHDVPLGRNNAPARRLSDSTMAKLESDSYGFTSGGSCRSELSDYTLDSNCKPIYYYAHEQEYWGLRLVYETPNLKVYGDVVGNSGNRRHYVYDQRHGQTQQRISGLATEIELNYQFKEHRYTLIGMAARGDEEIADPSRSGLNYKRDLQGYYEMFPGTYRGAQFYFNGGSVDMNSGTGLGHSINNTRMGGAKYRYDFPESELVYQGGLYELRRIRKVLDNNGDLVDNIGFEWDNTLIFPIANHAVMEVDLNMFQPGRAFSYDDHTLPGGIGDTIFHMAGRLFYSF